MDDLDFLCVRGHTRIGYFGQKMSELLLHVYSAFFDQSLISWLSNFTAKQTVICDPQ